MANVQLGYDWQARSLEITLLKNWLIVKLTKQPLSIYYCRFYHVHVKPLSSSTNHFFIENINWWIFSKVPVKQIEQHLAETSQSTINICVADLNNNCITGNILIGKIVKLKAVLVGKYSVNCITKYNHWQYYRYY